MLRLTRITSSAEYGTFGCLVFNGQPICVTLEPYHRDNKQGVSCIPAGCYTLERYDSPKFGDTWIIDDVQGRSYVLFHWGNLDDHTQGCVLLGESFGTLGGEWAILSSKQAFSEFMALSKGYDRMSLVISEAY